MPDGNNTRIIDACLAEFRQANELIATNGDLFELFVGLQITKEQNLAASDIASAIVDGNNDGGIDIFLPLVDEQPIFTLEDAQEATPSRNSTLLLLVGQSKYETSFREAVLDKLITSMSAILDLSQTEQQLALRFNAALTERVAAFRNLLLHVSRKGGQVAIRYVYATRSNEFDSSPAFQSKLAQLQAQTQTALSSAAVAVECISSKELFRLYQADPPERRELIFSGNPLAVSYKEGIGFLGLVPLRSLRKFISTESDQIDERVFESNVRHFQGSVEVNTKIKNTIRSDNERDFWWLNNGVTIVAPSASPMGNSLTLSNPQIVNGLQTSYSIFDSLEDSSSDNRCVLVKVIVSSDKSTIDKVISATNSQTAVGAASLRATDDVQRLLEAYFESKGYYYDRRKNFYRNRGKPIAKIFGISFVAQAIHAVLNRSPANARARPTSLIKDEAVYQSIFDANRDFQAYLNACLIVQSTRDYVSLLPPSGERTVLSNYVFHLAQVATVFALGSAHYTAREISQLALGRVVSALPQAAEWLGEFVTQYTDNNVGSNFITLSKSTPFADLINSSLHARLNG